MERRTTTQALRADGTTAGCRAWVASWRLNSVTADGMTVSRQSSRPTYDELPRPQRSRSPERRFRFSAIGGFESATTAKVTACRRPSSDVNKAVYLDQPYPEGESWRQAVQRCASVLDDIVRYWEGRRVLIIGHVATRWALDHVVNGVPLELLVRSDFDWQLGWEYRTDLTVTPVSLGRSTL